MDLGPLLEDYVKKTVTKSGRLVGRINRWALVAAPLCPDTYPKGNTLQQKRWELPEELYPYLYVSKEECFKTRNRLLAQVAFMDGAKKAPESVVRRVRQEYPDLEEEIFCPETGSKVAIADVQSAIRKTSRIGRQEVNVCFRGGRDDDGRLSLDALTWAQPPYHLYRLRAVFSVYKRLLSKVQTKAYLTDRRQTGLYPTNREARWEAHPKSPQFATFRECIKVEIKLLAQVFTFSGARSIKMDEEWVEETERTLGGKIEPGSFRCPISGQPIDYEEFMEIVESPEHGRSQYQVAHVVPLAVDKGAHVATNISWISELGNRVQGEEELDDIVMKIFSMTKYHKERLGLSWQEVARRADSS